jgi:hypothetical protein
MVFLHIDTKNYEKKQANGKTPIEHLNNIIHGNKNNKVFILYYMIGCTPCNMTKPEWAKMGNVLKRFTDNNDIAIVDIDQVLSSKVKNIPEPSGFPTMRFITNNGKTIENYEDSNIDTKDRTIDSFVSWVESKTNSVRSNNNIHRKKNITMRKQRGGKWSRKYKRSINCRRPKGFSQKQYCKYGRKK